MRTCSLTAVGPPPPPLPPGSHNLSSLGTAFTVGRADAAKPKCAANGRNEIEVGGVPASGPRLRF